MRFRRSFGCSFSMPASNAYEKLARFFNQSSGKPSLPRPTWACKPHNELILMNMLSYRSFKALSACSTSATSTSPLPLNVRRRMGELTSKSTGLIKLVSCLCPSSSVLPSVMTFHPLRSASEAGCLSVSFLNKDVQKIG